MWDLVTYIDRDLSLLLRERKGAYFLYAYPWKEPVKTDTPNEAAKAEVINVQRDRLFAELTVRAKFCAFNQIIRLARGSLNGKIPTTLEQLHTEALKFALRRFKKEQITSDDFIGMLRSAALIAPIPTGFWSYLSTFLKPQTLEKLQQSMSALAIFHEGGEDQWLEGQLTYMNKTAWFANDFDNIQTSCMQLAILFSEHALKDEFSELGRKAKSQLMRGQIEAEQANQKPWQRSGHGVKKSVRIGPATRPVKKPLDGEGDDKQ
ncbi:hypothetical protein [Pseudomonas serbica]|uniref:hypothetical protein n=1 Tax=Pseudomonas serbica TaxID=2965074 RepID=UPI00237C2E7C|nr:hypothetical protein [Pseudomonas serbica]